jgi:hypothetical protein
MKKSSKGSPALDEARLRQQAIGARLRQLFEDVVSEPVPEDFLDILRAAEPDDGGSDKGQGSSRAADGEA